MYGDYLKYNLLVALTIMLLLLMIQLEKLGFIAFKKSLTFFILLRNRKLWLRMRWERRWSVLDQIMEVNIVAMSLINIVHTMGFVERR